MTLLDRQRFVIAEPTATKAEPVPALLIDSISELWASEASLRSIAAFLGIGRGAVAGFISRARKSGDERFPARPPRPGARQRRLQYDRERYRKAHPAAVRRAPPIEAPIVREPVVKAPVIESAPGVAVPEPQLNLLLWELPASACRYPTINVPVRSGADMRFCGRRVENGRGVWCTQCRAIIYQPQTKSASKTGGKMALRDLSARRR